MQIRLSPSGAPIVAQNPGDILIWNGTEWETGPNPSGGTEFHTRIMDGGAGTIGVIALREDSVMQFTQWTEGQAVFVQSVVQIGGTSDGALEFELWWSGDGINWEPFWEPFGFQVGLSEGSTTTYPIQGQTPPIEGWESSTVYIGVAIGASGDLNCDVAIGHVQGQLFTPDPE